MPFIPMESYQARLRERVLRLCPKDHTVVGGGEFIIRGKDYKTKTVMHEILGDIFITMKDGRYSGRILFYKDRGKHDTNPLAEETLIFFPGGQDMDDFVRRGLEFRDKMGENYTEAVLNAHGFTGRTFCRQTDNYVNIF